MTLETRLNAGVSAALDECGAAWLGVSDSRHQSALICLYRSARWASRAVIVIFMCHHLVVRVGQKCAARVSELNGRRAQADRQPVALGRQLLVGGVGWAVLRAREDCDDDDDDVDDDARKLRGPAVMSSFHRCRPPPHDANSCCRKHDHRPSATAQRPSQLNSL